MKGSPFNDHCEMEKFSAHAHLHLLCATTPLRPAPFHHSFLQLSVQFAVSIFSRHLTISLDDSLIDPVTTSLPPLPIPRAILFIATVRFLLGPAWAPRIVRPGPYFNINFPDGDTSFASTRPRISPKLIIIRVPFLLPPAVARARARSRSPSSLLLRDEC